MAAKQQSAELSMLQHLATHPVFKKSQHIACYLAKGNEFPTQPLIDAIWRAGKYCYLPVVAEGSTLNFLRYEAEDELIANQYDILEPKKASCQRLPEELDLVIVPLVAFDNQGHRIGTGGGFYDRTFAFKYAHASSQPPLYGLAYSLQQAEELPHDPWDVILQGVITEQGVVEFK